MVRRSTPQKKTDDTAFPVRVKVRIPEIGVALPTDQYLKWLSENLGPAAYANHASNTIGGHATAFYFRDLTGAQAFLAAFPMLELADGTLSSSYSSPAQGSAWYSGELFGVCNLYSVTKGQDAIRAWFDGIEDRAGNLPPLKGIYPDHPAPVVSTQGGKPILSMMRWGMPSPAFALKNRNADRGITNVRNTRSPHWRRWLGVEHRCVVPVTSFAEPHNRPGMPSENVWFALDDKGSLAFFAGIWTQWTSVRKVKDGETTDNLFAFLTTEPNAEVAKVHPKAMPVILTEPDEVNHWMNAPVEAALSLQRPLSDTRLVTVDEPL